MPALVLNFSIVPGDVVTWHNRKIQHSLQIELTEPVSESSTWIEAFARIFYYPDFNICSPKVMKFLAHSINLAVCSCVTPTPKP